MPESIKGIKVIDTDTHLTEPADLWTSRAPAKYRDVVPRVQFLDNSYFESNLGWAPDGGTGTSPVWVVEDSTLMGYAGGASVINRSDEKVRGSAFIHWPLTEVSPAATQVGPRLAYMDRVGIWGQIVYPNAVGFGGQAVANIKDNRLRLLILEIWNDAMAEIQEQSGGRIMGMGLIPWWDAEAARKEVGRVHRLGLHGVNTNADPQNQGFPDLSDPFFAPMWEACEEYELPVNFHIGASVSQLSYMGIAAWPSMDNDKKLALGSSMLYIGNARIIANFIYSGLLDRHPRLKLVTVESGIGWIPFILDALDYQALENNISDLQLKPSEYFRRQCFGCFWFESERRFMDDVKRLGIDNCMFETDFPHPTCLYPEPLDSIAQAFDAQGVPWETRAKLLSGNAAHVYNVVEDAR